MKKFKENKQNIKWSIERLESKLNDHNITPKEVKVINACLRSYNFKLSRIKK
ncbi:MAG: hypothetical protein UZ05_CHB002001009 [Chlorobi bacterium OLB5]|nr:MAG: hypothetical protein UZ05_CHB002001009 [Chlorobi bacterium OLB5]